MGREIDGVKAGQFFRRGIWKLDDLPGVRRMVTGLVVITASRGEKWNGGIIQALTTQNTEQALCLTYQCSACGTFQSR